MLRLRPYKSQDAAAMVSWFDDEKEFTKWSADKFAYPLTVEQLNTYQKNYEKDEFAWPMAAVDEQGRLAGHLLMRMADYEKNSLHFGFIIVNPAICGKGYGKEMLTLALKYAFEILGVERVTLGVFDNNPAAHHCYQAVGFCDENYHRDIFPYKEEKWGIYDMAACKGKKESQAGCGGK